MDVLDLGDGFVKALEHSPAAAMGIFFIWMYFKNKANGKAEPEPDRLAAIEKKIDSIETKLDDLCEVHDVKGDDGVTPRWYLPRDLSKNLYKIIESQTTLNTGVSHLIDLINAIMAKAEKIADDISNLRIEWARSSVPLIPRSDSDCFAHR